VRYELDENERIDAVMDYHRRAGVKLGNLKLHAITHVGDVLTLGMAQFAQPLAECIDDLALRAAKAAKA
jgi:hypothetical protein